MFTQEQIEIANKTSRNSKAIGSKAIVPAYVAKTAKSEDTILDFGAGKSAAHTERLVREGFDVVAYDFGANDTPLHDSDALSKSYHTVFASNVLNVQQSVDMMISTIDQIANVTEVRAVVNFPISPRKSGITNEDLILLLLEKFSFVNFVGKSKAAPLFECKM